MLKNLVKYTSQKQMYEQKIHSIAHRIVSLYQYWVRPMVRGKSGKKMVESTTNHLTLFSFIKTFLLISQLQIKVL